MMSIQRIVLLLAMIIFNVCASSEQNTGTKEIVLPASEMQFTEPFPGVAKALLWGDPTKGPYGTINRFSKGSRSALHTHSHDIRIVVISGTFVYDSGKGEKRLGPGSYLLQPAGLKHTAGAGDDADCLFFEEGSGAFDLKLVK